jgi:hypothetical protein
MHDKTHALAHQLIHQLGIEPSSTEQHDALLHHTRELIVETASLAPQLAHHERRLLVIERCLLTGVPLRDAALTRAISLLQLQHALTSERGPAAVLALVDETCALTILFKGFGLRDALDLLPPIERQTVLTLMRAEPLEVLSAELDLRRPALMRALRSAMSTIVQRP